MPSRVHPLAESPDGIAAETGCATGLCLSIRDEMHGRFDALHRFVDRRIAELSAEVHGATQLLDYSEANLSGQLARIHEQVISVVATPSAASVNSGVELEAVVLATEQAANQIMEAAEAIGDWVRTGLRDAASLENVAERINSIFEACSFQDLTSQRIRRAIDQMKHVDTLLRDLAKPSPRPIAAPPKSPGMEIEVSGPDLAQAEIDRLLNEF
jgi:chemotaxis protein CheZ